jgi:hypothetical protein
MRAVVLCVLSWCVFTSLAFLSGLAKAGDNYATDPQRSVRVRYTSSCCYRKIVRDVTIVRYVRVKPRYRPYRAGYYRPYRYARPWRRYRARYYLGYHYWPRWRYVGVRYANYVPPPDCWLVRITSIDDTWVWARRAGCF